ncbi:MAG: hypothetical protein RIR11_610 [Bacteroidota bacterium]|jgi:hypothetical protein
MQKLLIFSFSLALLFSACKKDTIANVDEPNVVSPTDSVLLKGTFVGASYTTTGNVKLIQDKTGNKSLVFENFKTDAGPDLYIYLSKDKSASSFTELTDKVNNGNYTLAIPSGTDTDSKKFVLVWCKQFSVLFGSAELK